MKAVTGIAALVLAACAARGAPNVEIMNLAPDALPTEVRALVERAATGFRISEAQKKVREGRTYFDVEGELPDGSDLEFDILMTPAGAEIVEIQRDITWTAVPEAVRAAAQGAAPARVIESRQTNGTIIYELFAYGEPAEPAMEILLSMDGAVKVLEERWPH